MMDLTPRQRDVMALLVSGRSNSEIAAALRISENTVRKHLTAAAERAGFPDCNRVELAVWWARTVAA